MYQVFYYWPVCLPFDGLLHVMTPITGSIGEAVRADSCSPKLSIALNSCLWGFRQFTLFIVFCLLLAVLTGIAGSPNLGHRLLAYASPTHCPNDLAANSLGGNSLHAQGRLWKQYGVP